MSPFEYADVPTPTPGPDWQQMAEDTRCTLVQSVLSEKAAGALDLLRVVEAHPDGQVIFELLSPLTADQRGTFLLDVEVLLKERLDPALSVWLSPFDDKNKLRKLRGIKVKS